MTMLMFFNAVSKAAVLSIDYTKFTSKWYQAVKLELLQTPPQTSSWSVAMRAKNKPNKVCFLLTVWLSSKVKVITSGI